MAEHGLTVELHAYECHVFLDWRELRATAEKPWDALCDELAGRGVKNLEVALMDLELRPVHDALRHLLEPALVRNVAEVAKGAPGGVEKQKALEILREDFLEAAWNRCRKFLREAQSFYRSHADARMQVIDPVEMKEQFRARTKAAMRIPALEALFAEPWPAAARRVLPSYSPQLTATAMWGPVLAWTMLEVLAASVDTEHTAVAALDLFDRLRLREPLGQCFAALGFEGEEAWRVAARIKVALLIEAGIFAEQAKMEPAATTAEAMKTSEAMGVPAIPVHSATLWLDPDVRWLTGAHESEGSSYFVKEPYEELLWWLQLPALCEMAAVDIPTPTAAASIGDVVDAAEEAAAEAGYSVDRLTAVGVETSSAELAEEESTGDGLKIPVDREPLA
jgi:hypothetical protein